MNITAVRHGSVTPPDFVDWRVVSAVNTPVFDQKGCESCWLWAATDIISMKWSLMSHFLVPVPLSPQHVCDCGFRKCCSGGWPESTFLFAKKNLGVAALIDYPYLAKDNRKCISGFNQTGKITGWEKLPASTPTYLIKTVSMHPVVVLLQATTSFLLYNGGIFYGTDCPKRPTMNHALVVMGFNKSTPSPYWIAKNSWGTGWGEGGYIRISMESRVCGFGSEPSLYPTMFRVKTPCDAVPQPCSNGTCYLMPNSTTARCACPEGFVEKLEDEAPKCVTKNPCAVPINPCAFGQCFDEFDGTYTCWCPPGTVVGSRADSGETCIVNSFQSGLLTTQAIAGDNCTKLALTYNVTESQLLTMNPFLNCTTNITAGTVLVVAGALGGLGCSKSAVVPPNATCASLAASYNLTLPQLLAINPSLPCSSLLVSWHFCVSPGQIAPASQYERSCGDSYNTNIGETCISVMDRFNISSTLLKWLNPGVDCSQTLPLTSLCVSPLIYALAGLSCDAYYNVTQGDTCYTVAASGNLTLEDFVSLNPGLRCAWPNWVVGLTVCISGSMTMSSELDLRPNFIPYYVRLNDTLEKIASQYLDCADDNGGVYDVDAMKINICWANGWLPFDCSDRRVVYNALIFVPCVHNIGAIDCTGGLTFEAQPQCGYNGITYAGYTCLAGAFAAPPWKSDVCPLCDGYCTGLSGAPLGATWGRVPAGCDGALVCPYPYLDPAVASQLCAASGRISAECMYARVQCGKATMNHNIVGGSAASACIFFKRCLGLGMGFRDWTKTWSDSTSLILGCPYTSTVTCGTTNRMVYFNSYCEV